MPFKNFSMWRGQLPHWRADDVTYFVTFRHRRPLEPWERNLLLRALMRPEGRKWDLIILVVLPSRTDLIFQVKSVPSTGRPYELSTVVEKAKALASRQIIKKTEERFGPFYNESYDRIIRDEVELEERWQAIFDSPVTEELVEDSDSYDSLWVAGASDLH